LVCVCVCVCVDICLSLRDVVCVLERLVKMRVRSFIEAHAASAMLTMRLKYIHMRIPIYVYAWM
jgi:hypothetical protein